jgi:hypothetical protein
VLIPIRDPIQDLTTPMEEAVREEEPPAEAMKGTAPEILQLLTVPVVIVIAPHVEVTHEAMKTM